MAGKKQEEYFMVRGTKNDGSIFTIAYATGTKEDIASFYSRTRSGEYFDTKPMVVRKITKDAVKGAEKAFDEMIQSKQKLRALEERL
jgi:hypothetical protein